MRTSDNKERHLKNIKFNAKNTEVMHVGKLKYQDNIINSSKSERVCIILDRKRPYHKDNTEFWKRFDSVEDNGKP